MTMMMINSYSLMVVLIYREWQNSMPKLCEMMGGIKTNIYCQGTIRRRCVFAVLWTIKFWLRLEIKQNHFSILKKVLFCTNLEQMFKYGHWPWYVSNSDTPETDLYAQNMLGCCLMVASASVIREMRSSWESRYHHHLQWSLDCTEWANGLAFQVTGPHTNGLLPIGPQ